MLNHWVAVILSFAAHHPALQAGAVIVATFVLEDAATALAAMQAQAGALSVPLALSALYAGIVLGDLGLYGLGALAARVPLARRLLAPQHTESVRVWLSGNLFRVVLISRFLPGVRLPAYTTCGYLRADLRQFALATALGTSIWTSGLFALSWSIGSVLMAHLDGWRWAGAAGLVLFLLMGRQVMRSLFRLRPPVCDGSSS